jgi:hypothetical protein|nr:MAG TPA: hypothetical protein [Caudoviricetes sp.]
MNNKKQNSVVNGVKNVSAKVEKVNNVKNIIANFSNNTKGLLQTSLGTKKASLYKVDIFADCTDKEKKSLRKKLRNMLFSCATSLVAEKDATKKQELVKAFNAFYQDCYVNNDYSLQSVCNENLKAEKKEILEKALSLCKVVANSK